MLDEHRALIGRDCYVEVDGVRERGTIVDLLESMVKPYPVILYCVLLLKRRFPQFNYDIGTDTVELIGVTDDV